MSILRENPSLKLPNQATTLPLNQLFTLYGVEYEMDWEESAVNSGPVYAVWEVPENKYVALTTRLVQIDEGRANYRAFTFFTGGTESDEIPIIPMRLDTTITSESRFVKIGNPTTIDQTSKIVDIPLIGTTGGFFTPSQGDLSRDSSYRLYPPGSKILIQLENQGTAGPSPTIFFKLVLKWYEISPSAIPAPKSV